MVIKRAGADMSEEKKCKYCGKKGHGAAPALAKKREVCPAFDKKCNTCGKLGHLAISCPQPASLGDASAVIEGFEVNAMSDGFLSAKDKCKRHKLCQLCHIICFCVQHNQKVL